MDLGEGVEVFSCALQLYYHIFRRRYPPPWPSPRGCPTPTPGGTAFFFLPLLTRHDKNGGGGQRPGDGRTALFLCTMASLDKGAGIFYFQFLRMDCIGAASVLPHEPSVLRPLVGGDHGLGGRHGRTNVPRDGGLWGSDQYLVFFLCTNSF